MKQVKTYWANIYTGLKLGYYGKLGTYDDVTKMCQAYVDKVGLGLTVTKTMFLYTGGNEPGAIVGLINYPRFPSTKAKIRKHALELAKILKRGLRQMRVSVVFPDKTIMLGPIQK